MGLNGGAIAFAFSLDENLRYANKHKVPLGSEIVDSKEAL